MTYFTKHFAFLLFFIIIGNLNAQNCPDALTNGGSITLSNGSLAAGGDIAEGVTVGNGCGLRVANNNTNQPWSRYSIPISISGNTLQAGDQLTISIDATVQSGFGRLELVVNDLPNSYLTLKDFGTSGSHSATVTVPSNANTLDIWLFSNFNQSGTGSIIYSNLNVSKVGGTPPPGNAVWNTSGNDIFYNQGKVGIGTSSPEAGLHIANGNSQDIRIASSDNDPGKYMQIWHGSGGAVIDALKTDGSTSKLWLGYNNPIDIYLARLGGNVGIGTTNPDAPLTVNGRIHAKEVKVDLSVPGPDYVFKEDYKLRTLEEIRNYIAKNGHLPNIPAAKEMEDKGVDLGTMNMKLLEKIEELTLYILEQDDKHEQLEKQLEEINKKLEKL